MSTFPQHRAMHDASPYIPAIHTGPNHDSHTVLHQTAMIGNYAPCPYEDRVTRDGTTARMTLLFLRELLEQFSLGGQFQQNYGCPMTKCHRTFTAPLQVIQHLLSCPELPNGEFDCDKCSACHRFPTNEKDWTQWTGWQSHQPFHEGAIQRKRSFGSMKEYSLRKKVPLRRQHAAFDLQLKIVSTTGTRPSTAASVAPCMTIPISGLPTHVAFPEQDNHRAGSRISEHSGSGIPGGILQTDSGTFWPGLRTDNSGSSTVSSVSLSSTRDGSGSERLSQNTSQTTVFATTTGLGQYQHLSIPAQDPNNNTVPQHAFPMQVPFGTGLTSLPGHPPSASAMSLDAPLPMAHAPVSTSEPQPTAPSGGCAWWNTKFEVNTRAPTLSASGPDACFPMQAPMSSIFTSGISSGVSSPTSSSGEGLPYYQAEPSTTDSMSRALSHESVQTGMTTVFGTPTPERNGHLLSPHSGNDHHAVNPPGTIPADTSPEELVCDECQWKPRGVRENLKGYLRKHKNTHKGVRLACDVAGCTKTFSRLDNLKKHKRDKHGIEDAGNSVPAKRPAADLAEHIKEEESGRSGAVESKLNRGSTENYSMLWPALHSSHTRTFS
ncbi:hypothetical protein VTI74DRAFT_8064 [Chaetomium olivicolor]